MSEVNKGKRSLKTKLRRFNLRKAAHNRLTKMNVPRRKDGNKLGLRKRNTYAR